MKLYFLDYNNYYNRVVKKEGNSIDNYTKYILGNPILNVSFNPNDGISASQVVNRTQNQIGNYMICVSDKDSSIVSRWFIIEAKRNMTGQYFLTLTRDILVDYYEDIINADTYISKARLNALDSFIYNRENFNCNQIKQNEYYLEDETHSQWVVGFIPRDSIQEETEISFEYPISSNYDIEVDNLENWNYSQYLNDTFVPEIRVNQNIFNIYAYNPNNQLNSYKKIQFNYDGYTGIGLTNNTIEQYQNQLRYKANVTVNDTVIVDKYMPSFTLLASQAFNLLQAHSRIDTNNFLNLNGKVIKDNSTNKYWRVKIVTNNVIKASEPFYQFIPTNSELFTTMNSLLPSEYFEGSAGANSFSIGFTDDINIYKIALEEAYASGSVTISSDRGHLLDQPFDMFCIPCSSTLQVKSSGNDICVGNKDIAISVAQRIATQLGSGSIYDIQLLPFCPIRNYIYNENVIDYGLNKANIIKSGDNNIGIILWSNQSQFSFNIYKMKSFNDNTYVNIADVMKVSNDPIKVKEQNELEFYRLSSSNYSSNYDFTIAKNGGVEYFNVDCYYAPYSSYIHINPNFSNLYGNDYNDTRGLIVRGDYSLTQSTDAWANYILQNKNYEDIFKRQQESQEFANRYQNIGSTIGGLASAISSGLFVGGALGVGAGLFGGILSGVAGGADLLMQSQLQKESMSYARDIREYNLDNIQAIPQGLSRVSALNNNNKIFPILEYYSCSEKEKEAFRNHLKYSGMKVGRIDKISNFLTNDYEYISGDIIRLEINEDNSLLQRIATEINKGVYIKWV